MKNQETIKQLEDKIDTMQKIAMGCIETIYNGAFNEGVDEVVEYLKDNVYPDDLIASIRKLKK